MWKSVWICVCCCVVRVLLLSVSLLFLLLCCEFCAFCSSTSPPPLSLPVALALALATSSALRQSHTLHPPHLYFSMLLRCFLCLYVDIHTNIHNRFYVALLLYIQILANFAEVRYVRVFLLWVSESSDFSNTDHQNHICLIHAYICVMYMRLLCTCTLCYIQRTSGLSPRWITGVCTLFALYEKLIETLTTRKR